MGSQVRELNRLHKDNSWPRLLTFKQGYRWAWPVVKGEPSHMNLNFVRSALPLTHTLQTFEPVRFIPRFYCIYLLHAEGEIVDFSEKKKKTLQRKFGFRISHGWLGFGRLLISLGYHWIEWEKDIYLVFACFQGVSVKLSGLLPIYIFMKIFGWSLRIYLPLAQHSCFLRTVINFSFDVDPD